MQKAQLQTQVASFLQERPDFSAEETDQGYCITGRFTLNNEFGGVCLYDEYEVEILVPYDYPWSPPSIRETAGALPAGFEHRYADGGLCIGTGCDVIDFVDSHPSLAEFVDGIVASYFFSASYFKKYGTVPYGERAHGIEGIIEAYQERFGTEDEKLLIHLLAHEVGWVQYRGHKLCPCGSGERFRSCHGAQIIKDLQSPRKEYYERDAQMLLSYFARKYEE
ncbi:MAG TPA: hypothetical protein DDZ84_02825 [Firmicutes bacterium]|jgi:hypothetical protein|nr:hypothetical protein [Bacillota bacterium]